MRWEASGPSPRPQWIVPLATLVAVLGCTPEPPHPRKLSDEEALEFDPDQPKKLYGLKLEQSKRGKPEKIGCADGQREGFKDLEKFDDVAGCYGRWEGFKSLASAPTGEPCGDDKKGHCNEPADVCAEGWHVCGAGGNVQELRERLAWEHCQTGAGPSKFIAAISHNNGDDRCDPWRRDGGATLCKGPGFGGEAVCCGKDCEYSRCRNGVWRRRTRTALGPLEGCAKVSSDRNGGIMCCKDEAAAAAGAVRRTTPVVRGKIDPNRPH